MRPDWGPGKEAAEGGSADDRLPCGTVGTAAGLPPCMQDAGLHEEGGMDGLSRRDIPCSDRWPSVNGEGKGFMHKDVPRVGQGLLMAGVGLEGGREIEQSRQGDLEQGMDGESGRQVGQDGPWDPLGGGWGRVCR